MTIGGQSVVGLEDGEWSVWAAAFNMLRTVTADHTASAPVGEHTIPSCGYSFYLKNGAGHFIGDPRGVNWWVQHSGPTLRLYGFVRTDTTSEPGKRFDVDAILSFDEYRAPIVRFAENVAAFYRGVPKRFGSDAAPGWCDEGTYGAIWKEYNTLLERFK